MASITNKIFWREFIAMYKGQPSLWNANSEVYRSKPARRKSLQVLLAKLKQIEPTATIDNVKQRIGCLRSSYKRELKKVEKSQRKGDGPEDAYMPNLWYFHDMDFLRDQKIQPADESICDSDEGGTAQEENKPVETPAKRPRMTHNHEEERTKYIKMACESLCRNELAGNKTRDEADVYAEGWAVSYRKLDNEQKIFAKKAIEDILILGQCKQLTFDLVPPQFIPPQAFLPTTFHQETIPPKGDALTTEIILSN